VKPKPQKPSDDRDGLFRADFLRVRRARNETGDVLRVTPTWVEPTFWLMVAYAVIGFAWGIFGHVHEYAVGQAIVRFSDRADLTALSDGTVLDVLARPGETVANGQILVRFYSSEETAELDRVEREFQLQLVALLRDPLDQDARQSMARLRSERDRMRSRLDERALRSPIAGIVSDILIRPGQHLSTGDPIMKILGKAPKLTVIAALPGEYRPLLKPGLPLELQLNGYPYSHEDLTISAIGDEIVGPGAVRRFLGSEVADAVPVSGPTVLVYADLSRRGFRWEGRERPYYDGMVGRAEVVVQDQSMILALVPGLRALLEGSHD